ncbi:hypothetical protein M2432_001209 [Mycobacterium sp. OTB74]|jgi:hypothetical protein|nr:hypothetical protein [Mycobacterium sp. OTB74]
MAWSQSMTGRSRAGWALTATVVLAVASCSDQAMTGLALPASNQPVPQARPLPATSQEFGVGDCVALPPVSPAVDVDPVGAVEASCGADPSYTVGAIADHAGTCPSGQYQQITGTFADSVTARLCLVPNLVADHCYSLDMPIGLVQLADCTDRNRPGVLVKVTRRLDVADSHACPAAGGNFTWPYPSPPRTYCTRTMR